MQIQTLDGIYRAIFCLIIFGALTLFGEFLRRRKYIEGELARKFVHTTTGTWAALWPIFLDLRSIAVIAGFLTAGALILRFLLPLKTIYSIKRLSIGEILIGIGIAVSAWFSESGSVFSAAVLIISWSDSVAAIVGTTYGSKNSFKVFKSKKSVIGSSAFFITTLGIIFGYYLYDYNLFTSIASINLSTAITYSIGISFILTLAELTGVYGSDNLTVPILSVIILNLV